MIELSLRQYFSHRCLKAQRVENDEHRDDPCLRSRCSVSHLTCTEYIPRLTIDLLHTTRLRIREMSIERELGGRVLYLVRLR